MGRQLRRLPPVERFWTKIEKTPTCWIWKGTVSNGYGRFWTGERSVPAHRYSYELTAGPIPKGLVIDHLCRVTDCVNPEHLEAVTPFENSMRGNGHWAAHHAGRDCGGPKCAMCISRFRSGTPQSYPEWVTSDPLVVAHKATVAERDRLREWADSLQSEGVA